MVGTMIELPRAALTADQIAEEAEFFSLRHQRPDADHLRHLARRHQQLPACVPEGRHLQAGSVRHPRPGWRRAAGEDGHRQGTQHPAQPQGRHLRRTRRRSRVRQVLPQDRPQLRVLLALPSADGAAGSGPGSPAGSPDRARSAQRYLLIATARVNSEGAAQCRALAVSHLSQDSNKPAGIHGNAQRSNIADALAERRRNNRAHGHGLREGFFRQRSPRRFKQPCHQAASRGRRSRFVPDSECRRESPARVPAFRPSCATMRQASLSPFSAAMPTSRAVTC